MILEIISLVDMKNLDMVLGNRRIRVAFLIEGHLIWLEEVERTLILGTLARFIGKELVGLLIRPCC